MKKPNKPDYSRLDAFRLVCDFRMLNSIGKPMVSTLPFIETLRERMKGFQFLSKLDIASAFFSISVHPNCIKYLQTTTSSDSGNMFYHRLPQGIWCAPSLMQTTMQRILDSITETVDNVDVKQFIFCYVDDIFVCTFEGGSEFHWKVLKSR